ncbi:uncharacterized protein DUF559 [Modestobacter roseus]|uniref:Uncharacterized protein DUF559 n=1 Tax=Modestobacter roseus TaxID=1181884 RepID=A0A562IMN4_9ACTN|nr:DUF559 domain-containing protein [Modestobacter roseus]MQA34097.1 DUF559 domain-containing protein [Modestobacter roseus]TWH72096.1 uncharacterized protein DUF559 [Modestobacter roseus]
MHALPELLGPTRTSSIADLTERASSRSVGRWLAGGRLVRLHPGWVTAPGWADDWTVRAHAAVGYTGGVLSHRSALAVHGALDHRPRRLDVTVGTDRRLRSTAGLAVHRGALPRSLIVSGLPATTLARALVDSWAGAHRRSAGPALIAEARAALLRSARERAISTAALGLELDRRPELPGRSGLVQLIALLERGCQSELEVFGVLHVLSVPGLPGCVQQYRVRLPDGRRVYLDAAWPGVKLAIELDGAAFHGGREQRERDLTRDAALAARGWLVLRFSHARLTREPAECQAEIAAVYQQRLILAR